MSGLRYHSWFRGVIVFPAFLGALLCHALSSSSAQELPLNIPLIKLEYPGTPQNIRMLYINILFLGYRKIAQPLLFDTGSSGMTIDCTVVLPTKMCSEKGIKIKKTFELDGLTVTTQKTVMHYGTYDEYGNVASARVIFGSADSAASTAVSIPFLIRYKEVRRSTGEVVGGPLWPKGIFGVSPLGGGGPNQMLKSPLNSVSAGNGLRQGYFLSPIGTDWKVCTNEDLNCPQIDALHIGLSDSVKKDFKIKKWERASKNYNFPTTEACIFWGKKPICRPTLYDTGNSTIMVAGGPPKKPGLSLDTGVNVTVTSPNHDEWRFTTTYKPEVEFVPQIEHHIIGVRYFETNSLLFDLESKEIGFRIGK
ncbi:hypothetical protein [Mesorhizobium onobrychidis]|uniref:Peptidase A1 domain-containing protein n=1 Tax=Mesorhizobium onobrychidis TaxID=2775404 RepID=A0ABY5QRU6_9HYPH|nr:hypothetical protein [Mesorhizobium onobrychidis]UVC13654.1 hypothetical protein IHQ72_23465 [Mesorhizobium onobrychidis]